MMGQIGLAMDCVVLECGGIVCLHRFDSAACVAYNAPRYRMWEQDLGRYRSGQPGQTVNLLAYAFAGSNPARPTK